MKATHYLAFDNGWTIQRIEEEGEWTLLYTEETRADAIARAKGMGNITILDDEAIMIFELEDGKVTDYSYEYDMDYKAYAEWTGEQLEPAEEYECSTCRGGGCVHCEPHRFIRY